ncbi:hypothetical protein HOY80DRAFT_1033274 [Tuber brumale]|nr:hypothetical protein HOY80DRAFT_1033274 [Tuber brumale]
MVTKGYRQSNMNDVAYQILHNYARLISFKFYEMNINAHIRRHICDEPGYTPMVDEIVQFEPSSKDLLRLILDYYG